MTRGLLRHIVLAIGTMCRSPSQFNESYLTVRLKLIILTNVLLHMAIIGFGTPNKILFLKLSRPKSSTKYRGKSKGTGVHDFEMGEMGVDLS